VTPIIRSEDLIDAQGIAMLLGLAQRNTISAYQRRYPDMPRPIVNLGPKRTRLWLRPEIEAWARRTGRLPDDRRLVE
jgi:glutathione-regulated potassium-efflux system ancillary protein KefG